MQRHHCRISVWFFTLSTLLCCGPKGLHAQSGYTGNPIIDHFESADPHIAFVNNKYYIYPTDNTRKDPGFDVWSSDNLKDWVNEGNILSLQNVDFAKGRPWAPALAERNGRCFFYFSADDQIGVAVNDAPTGVFKEPFKNALVAYEADLSTIDPMVFIDDDGQAYLYYGAVPGTWRSKEADVFINSLMVRKLSDDMTSFVGERKFTVRAVDGHIEGSFVFKRKGVYYLMYSKGNYNEKAGSPSAYRLEYATSATPLGPFTPAMNNPILVSEAAMNLASPGHNSVLEIPGIDEWYVVYHAHEGDVKRRVFIDRMEFDEEGKIKTIIPTRTGVKVNPIRLKLHLDKTGPYAAGSTLGLTVETINLNSKNIELYANGGKLTEWQKPPYRFNWEHMPAGFYKLYAKSTDADGRLRASCIWNIDVR